MKHKLNHRIKLFFVRIKWWLKSISNNARFDKRVLSYMYLRDMKSKLHSEYIVQARKFPTHKNTYILQGKTEILEDLIKHGIK
jgi:hypothetical protein